MIFYKTKLIPEYQTNATKFKNKIVDQVSCDFDFQAFQTLELTVKRLLDIKDYSQFMLAYGLEHATIVDDQSSQMEFQQCLQQVHKEFSNKLDEA